MILGRKITFPYISMILSILDQICIILVWAPFKRSHINVVGEHFYIQVTFWILSDVELGLLSQHFY